MPSLKSVVMAATAVAAATTAAYYIRRGRVVDPGNPKMDPADLALLVKAERVSRVPGIARYLIAVGSGESNWASPTRWAAHNTSPREVAASAAAVKRGLEVGLPALLHADEAAADGSRGMFGLLVPYALWRGKPDYPFVELRPEDLDDPARQLAAAIDTVVASARRGVTTWPQMRVSWKSLKLALEDPDLISKASEGVLQRMADDIAKIDAKPLDEAPISIKDYTGMRAVLMGLGQRYV